MIPPLPRYLYKFRSLVGEQRGFTRDIIEHRRLYWPMPAQFNDPFDCAPVVVIQGSVLKRESYIRKMVRQEAPHLPKYRRKQLVKLGLSRPIRETELLMADTQQQIRREIGVCSFSESFDHILMWAHYADAHRGICLRFNVRLAGPRFALAFPVTYSPERPVINMVEKRPKALMEQVLLTKADFWQYEREWRLFDHVRGPGLYEFPPPALDGIIFGAAISAEDREEVTSWASAAKLRSELLQARLDDQLFKLRVDKIDHQAVRT
ncbi:MAG TPA: DUF2971 domain-containing protein [Allosphingosinicella sp.]|nr:DUF2971 domain-containing protein [Allosphingosinicella sp.]